MIELLQGFSIAKGLVFGHSQKKRDKPINPKPVLIDNNADINQNIRSIFPCSQNCQVYSGCLIGPIMTNCLHQVMLPKKPFVCPFQNHQQSSIFFLRLWHSRIRSHLFAMTTCPNSASSIQNMVGYFGVTTFHLFPFTTFLLTFHPL